MAQQVHWSPEALEDLETLIAYIAAHNVPAAIATGRAIPLNPMAGRVVPERRDSKIREVFHGNYRIIYRLVSPTGKVEIMRIWHGARGEPGIL